MEVTRGEKRIPSATFLPPITQGSDCPAPVSVTTCHGQRTVTSPSQVPALRRHRGETRPMRLSRGWAGQLGAKREVTQRTPALHSRQGPRAGQGLAAWEAVSAQTPFRNNAHTTRHLSWQSRPRRKVK